MEGLGRLSVLLLLALLPIFSSGNSCLSPAVKSIVYTTTDASVSSETVVIAEFFVKCNNGVKGQNLFAAFNGKTVPASVVDSDANKYQVSFTSEEGRLSAGKYEIRVYDDEGFSSLRKAQRSGEDPSTVKSLFDIDVDHKGTWKGPYIQSEFVAAMAAIGVWYFAYRARSNLQ